MAKRDKKQRKTTEWVDLAEEVPRAGMPDARKLEKRRRLYRVFLWSAVFLFPLSLVANILILGSTGGSAPAAVVQGDKFSDTKSVAMVSVETWLKQDPTPLPGGRLLSWDRAEELKNPPAEKNSQITADEVETFETHYMTVTNDAGLLFTSSVQLVKSRAQGIEIVAEPSLIPRAPGNDGGWAGNSPWPAFPDRAAAPEPVDQAVAAWAKAFTSGDPSALRLAVGDTQPGHSYLPLNGLSVVGTNIDYSAWKFSEEEITNQAEDSGTMIAQVSISVAWTGQRSDIGAESPVLTYDIRIEKANTAAPVVTAWGAQGAAPSLKRFTNALVGRSIVAGEPETAPDPAAAAEDPAVTPDAATQKTPVTPKAGTPVAPSSFTFFTTTQARII